MIDPPIVMIRAKSKVKGLKNPSQAESQKDGSCGPFFFLATGYLSLSTLDPVVLRPCFSTGLPFSKSI
jgi:hypothetical protein